MTEWDLGYMRRKVEPQGLTDADIDRIADAVPIDQIGVHITTWHRRFARAVLAAQPAPVPVPPGYKLVPVEPTREMISAGIETACKQYDAVITAALADGPEPEYETSAEAVYRAMIAASPEKKP